MPEKFQAHVSEYDGPEAAGLTAESQEPQRTAVRPLELSITRDEGAPAVQPERFSRASFSHYSNRELEGLIHVLIFRIDLLLAGLKLADWGDQDFTRTIAETEAILNTGSMYEVGRAMDRMIRALESVADAAQTTARYSMLSPGYMESTEQLEEALTILYEIQRTSPVPPPSPHDQE